MIKFYCKECGKEIWEDLNEVDKNIYTIKEMEKRCICSDCILKDIKKEEKAVKAERCPYCLQMTFNNPCGHCHTSR